MAAETSRLFDCTPEDVFAVLADGWLYPSWVVGAARMRDVDSQWPAEGARLHHSLGLWMILIDDTTEVVEWSPPQRVRLRAKAGPFGRAVIVIDVKARADGCVVRMGEELVGTAGKVLPRLLWVPVMRARNVETLRRLGYLAEGRRRESESDHDTARPTVPDPPPGTPRPDAVEDVESATGVAAADAPDASEAPHPHNGTESA